VSCLVVLSGRAKGRTFQISPDRDNIIGRAADCGIWIMDSHLSRRHCVISPGTTGYTIRDLGSSNGIFLNDVKVVKEAVLSDSDRLRLGSNEMTFHLTERFEDAETRRLKPGQQAAATEPAAAPAGGRRAAKQDTEALLAFCARCSGSITPAEFTSRRARKIDGEPVCVECIAREIAAGEAAGRQALTGGAAETREMDFREGTRRESSAEEISRLASEVAREAQPCDAAGPAASSAGDDFSTDELIFNDAGRPAPGPAPGQRRSCPSAPTVVNSPREMPGHPASGGGPETAPDPDLPPPPGGAQPGFDENAETPRPGSQMRVI
jgi:predicted component of type VI protein secretion system